MKSIHVMIIKHVNLIKSAKKTEELIFVNKLIGHFKRHFAGKY